MKQKSLEVKFNSLIGVISKEDEARFKRITFRAMKGNVLIFLEEINENNTKQRVVFTILFPGGNNE